ncbi:MAG TPA: methionyl-tRNA formyltransferase [Ktedonobacterales bacterium]|nr:methionyl-tRNA formyltransferase [Ktedonobacterales bacterium]
MRIEETIRVLFMGTPDFAVPSLQALTEQANAGLAVAGVVTRPDKPAGRKQRIVLSPVKQFALEHGIAVYQPGPLRRPEALELLRDLAPDLIVVAAFGQLLPPEVLSLPLHGCLNVHASLLPRWRGASPINAAILAGDTETGVTIMLMDAGLDTGPMIARRATPIGPDETAGELSDRLARMGADLLVETVPRWLAGVLMLEPQDDSQATMTRLLRKSDGRLDWQRPADELARLVRASTPWPGAFTIWDGRMLKIQRATALSSAGDKLPGACFIPAGGASLAVACGQGALALEVIQLEGKRALPAADVVRGYPAIASAHLNS